MKIYLAGPMTGYKDFNFPAFMSAAQMLRDLGHDVFNPAEQDLKRDGAVAEAYTKSETGDILEAQAKGFDKRVAITDDLMYIINEAEAIALLPGWENSKGANAEFWTARFLDLEILQLLPASDVDKTIGADVELNVEAVVEQAA